MTKHSNVIPLDVDQIVNWYQRGKSENAIAKQLNVSRNVIRRRLEGAGVHIRSQSEAEAVKWEHMSERQRQKQVQAAHKAARGRKRSFEELCKGAKSREQNASADSHNISHLEISVREMLLERGIKTIMQKAIGPYNCDLATSPVAVEIYGGHWHWYGRHLSRVQKRFNYILNSGWCIYVLAINRNYPLTGASVDHLASYIQSVRREKPSVCEYRVVWGAGKFMTTGSLEDDDISIEPPFTGTRDSATGQYKTVRK